MIYLDYSATTPVNDEVLDTYVKVCKNFIGNPNSLHKLGIESKKLIDASSRQIADILHIKPSEIIYTSGASEANNLAILGVASKYYGRGKHIITTQLEHSSVLEPLKYLEKFGFKISYVKLDKYGRVDLNDLEKLITKDTILVSICAVNSEVGIVQDIESISKIIRKHNGVLFHSDFTQCIGKMKIDFSLVDMASLSCQKFFGMKGIGALIKRENLVIDPIIHGGKSTTIYRSGTPATPLITSFAKALRLAYEDFTKKENYVKELHNYLIEKLNKLDVDINSNKYSINNIINFSLRNIKSEVMLHALEQKDIYISTQTACSTGAYSKAVMAVTNNLDKSSRSMRISISYLTTNEEIDRFIETLDECIKKLSYR